MRIGVYVAEQSEYERQIESLNDSKQVLFERYCMGEIDVETYKTEKATIDAEILRTNNACTAVTAQAKHQQEEQVQRDSRNEIWSAVAEADGLTPELADMLIEKVVVFPDKRIGLIY
jgi:chromosome segregation ATPase